MEQENIDVILDHVNFSLPPPRPGEEWLSLPELPTAGELNLNWGEGASEADVFNNVKRMRNDVTKPYESKLKYLETHYRLNREEGITFLRYGVLQYKRNPTMMDNEHTCVYTKVFVQGYYMTKKGPICRIQFSTIRAGKRIPWSLSPRLRPGTVVAISTALDNFQTICKVATIEDRRLKDGLERKPALIDIKWARIGDAVINPTEELVMIESRRGFFEAVRYTLVGLQHVARASSPILKHLLHDTSLDCSPEFVKNNPRMDLSPLLHHLPQDSFEKERLLNNYRNYDILKGITDEIRPHTSLDGSQLQAVHRILTKELAIVQGPPGTGKTFTSVESLRCMINTLTGGMAKKPEEVIIVAAETNHAVDQILTHLIKYDLNVVRLGGRTRDDIIKKYSLFNVRAKARNWNGRHAKDSNNVEEARKQQIKELEDVLSGLFPRKLLDPTTLLENSLITGQQFKSFAEDEESWQSTPGRPSGVMSEWLDNALTDISLRRIHDPVFDDEELFEAPIADGTDEKRQDLDSDDPAFDDSDSVHLRGTWIPVDRKWAGYNPQNISADNIVMRQQLKRQDVWEIEKKWRGPIYEYWQRQLLSKRSELVLALLTNYSRLCKKIKTRDWKRDVQLIKSENIHIVGCTTTGLSKYRGFLAALRPKIILIEEAAQNREAHIAAALIPSLQQLVLVGDHQQLPPQCDVPALADGYHNLTVSMFERLITYLDVPYIMLNQQRRMISDIRAVLNPFYPELGDHPSVWDKNHRPDVPGMLYNSYLFTHDWVEGTDMEMLSKYNDNEAEMVVLFALYLIQNRIQPNQITILTFYRAQRKKIIFYARRHLTPIIGHANINVSTVDSYQGEENDIVILSLVRSNDRNRPGVAGFVGDMNRGVVSISRARRGFYVFGNIQNLEAATETSQFIWGNVRSIFERLDRYASRLPLRCEKHGNITYISNSYDFKKTIGGCLVNCTEVFQICKHPCGRTCHPLPHEKLICQKPCTRKLRCGHRCSEKCGENCCCALKCSAFMGSMKLPNDHPASNPCQPTRHHGYITGPDHWNNYNSALDDAIRRVATKLPSQLIDVGQNAAQPQDDDVRGENYLVNLNKNGYRAAINPVTTLESSSVPLCNLIGDQLTPVTHYVSSRSPDATPTRAIQQTFGNIKKRTIQCTKHLQSMVEQERKLEFSSRNCGLETDLGHSLEALDDSYISDKSNDNYNATLHERIQSWYDPFDLLSSSSFDQLRSMSSSHFNDRLGRDWEESTNDGNKELIRLTSQHILNDQANDVETEDLITL